MKVQISIDDKLLSRLDRYADENYMSRSGLISLSCTEYLNSRDFMILVKDVSLAMRKIADTGEVDKEIILQLQDITRAISLIDKQ